MRNKKFILIATLMFAMSFPIATYGETIGEKKSWSLEDCISYAMQHNIQIKQNALSEEQCKEDELGKRATMFPSVSASTNQSIAYRPWGNSFVNVENGTLTESTSSFNYNGSYGLNANWTIFNGGRNLQNYKRSKLSTKKAALATKVTSNSIQEQITQIYVQILYQAEAIEVNKALLETAKAQCERAKTMVELGQMAKVELVQLESALSTDEYNLVNSEAQLQRYKLQLRQILEITSGEDFDVVIPEINDDKILTILPDKNDVYVAAVGIRPEIKSKELEMQMADIDLSVAKRGYSPTASLRAGISTSHASGTQISYADQMQRNFNNSVGLSVNIPIYSNRETKTQVQKAKLSQQASELSLQSEKKTLYSTIESYWISARTAQQEYIAALKNLESSQENFNLLSEQFNLGMKNIIELSTGKNNLMRAQQQVLQTKYTALLNMAMLRFYEGKPLEL